MLRRFQLEVEVLSEKPAIQVEDELYRTLRDRLANSTVVIVEVVATSAA